MSDKEETKPDSVKFDFDAFPMDTLFHERRTAIERRLPAAVSKALEEQLANRPKSERRAKKERRRRIDPTTFEKQYTDDELEFMNAMQSFKNQSGKSFPSHGDVLRVSLSLGYRKIIHSETSGPNLEQFDQDHASPDFSASPREALHPESS